MAFSKLGGMSGTSGNSESRLSSGYGSIHGIDYSLGGENANLKIQVSQFVTKRLRLQKKVHDTQLRNVKVVALGEAREYIKSQTSQI